MTAPYIPICSTKPIPPVGVSTSDLSAYDSIDTSSAPAQSIYPAHRISHAHESSVWSLDWHPLGHILASGSNDHFTRFWSRARPGETNCFKDQYHLGEEGAEAQGTWDRKYGRKQAREQEEQELEDEAEGLEDQRASTANPGLAIPGLPIPGINGGGPSPLPGMGNVPPPPMVPARAGPGNPGLPSMPRMPNVPSMPGMDPARLAQLFPQANSSLPPPPPPPGAPGGLPMDFSKFQLPSDFKLPPGFPHPPMASSYAPGQPQPNGLPGLSGSNSSSSVPGYGAVGEDASNGGVRRRAPLPSQQESLIAEQRRGNFRISR